MVLDLRESVVDRRLPLGSAVALWVYQLIPLEVDLLHLLLLRHPLEVLLEQRRVLPPQGEVSLTRGAPSNARKKGLRFRVAAPVAPRDTRT